MSQLNSYLQSVLADLSARSRLRSLKTLQFDHGPTLDFEGKTYINFSSNNYLGLANHPELIQASISATQKYGTGSGASRLITGSMALHEELESKLATFKNCEAALVFNSGYQANIGVIPSLMISGDCVFSDELNHASLIDGCRLSQAKTLIYKHADLNHLETLLKNESGAKHKLVVTDSIFSMDGDLAPLPELLALCETYGAWLLVDEAHATGVFGANGRGLIEHFGLDSRHESLIHMGTLGKALGSFGAYICGSQSLKDFLINKSRSFIYTTSLPPGVLGASIAGIECVQRYPQKREQLHSHIQWLKQALEPVIQKRGWQLGESQSPILPIIIGSDKLTMQVSQDLLAAGIWVTGIRPPTVGEGQARLRLTLMSSHSQKDLSGLVKAI